jgi:hypothetical protein
LQIELTQNRIERIARQQTLIKIGICAIPIYGDVEILPQQPKQERLASKALIQFVVQQLMFNLE